MVKVNTKDLSTGAAKARLICPAAGAGIPPLSKKSFRPPGGFCFFPLFLPGSQPLATVHRPPKYFLVGLAMSHPTGCGIRQRRKWAMNAARRTGGGREGEDARRRKPGRRDRGGNGSSRCPRLGSPGARFLDRGSPGSLSNLKKIKGENISGLVLSGNALQKTMQIQPPKTTNHGKNPQRRVKFFVAGIGRLWHIGPETD